MRRARRDRVRASDREALDRVVAAVRAVRLRATVNGMRMQVDYFLNPENHRQPYAAQVSGLEDGEPIFPLRARDALALGLLSQYRMMTSQADLFDASRDAELGEAISAFVAWRRTHAELVRDPD